MSSLQEQYDNLCGEVTVTYDPKIKEEYEKKMQDKEFLKQLEIQKEEYYFDLKEEDKKQKGLNYNRLGDKSEINKIKRMQIFKDGYEKGEFVTLTAAVDYMKYKVANGLSYNTCKKYSKELNISIFDDRNDKWIMGNISPQEVIEKANN